MLSSLLQALIHRDSELLGGAVLAPVFGTLFVFIPLFLAAVVYLIASVLGAVNRIAAVTTGIVIGSIMGYLGALPLLPIWSAAIVGAAAGLAWWDVYAKELPAIPSSNTR